MKKSLSFIFLLLMSVGSGVFAAQSSTVDRFEFLHSGSETERTVTLNTEVTRIEYRTVQSWCQRRICPRPVCRRVCNPNGQCRRSCRNSGPCHTRTVRCMRQVAVEVFDHFVENVVTFFFDNNNQNVSEEFNLKQSGDNFSLDVDSSKRFVVVLDKEQVIKNRQGNRDMVKTNLYVNFVDVNPIYQNKNAGIQNVKLNKNILSFDIPKSDTPFDTKLKLLRRKIGSDRVLFNRVLGRNDVEIEDKGNFERLTVDFKRIGVKRTKKFSVNIKHGYFPLLGQKVLNANELARLYDVRIFKYK
jgi:hypothetical protein